MKMNCPLCNSNQKIKKVLSECEVSICEICTLNFIESKQDDEYYNGFHEHFDLSNSKIDELRNKQYEIHAKHLQNTVKEGRILDVGCSSGELLGRISKKEFELVGIDPDKSAIDNAIKDYPQIKFHNVDLINFDTELIFDAFVFRGTFQYLSHDLSASLKKIREIGRKGSKIIIYSLPNSDSIIYKILGDRWHMFHKLEHTLIFNRNSFINMCKIYNFEMVECSYPYLETPYANLEQDYEDLINLIKNDSKKSFPFWGNIMQVVLKLN